MSKSFDIFLKCNPPKSTGNNNKKCGYNPRMGRAVMYSSEKDIANKADYRALLLPHVPPEPLDGPLSVTIVVIFPLISKDMSNAKKRAELELQAWVWHPGKPDADNFCKQLFDVMTRLRFWTDDSRICDLHFQKKRGKYCGISIIAEEIIDGEK
jgi:Holliday junction resolvase RusA-like endonuclease